jgi:hypothetical protein
VLKQQNVRALKLFVDYWSCFVESYKEELGVDHVLPLSQVLIQGGKEVDDFSSLFSDIKFSFSLRSAFVASSGHCDKFETIEELCTTYRRGLYLDPKMVPIFDVFDQDIPLNAYLLDFYKHGQFAALETYNKISKDSIWDRLQSFSLLLKALWASMERRHRNAQSQGQQTAFGSQTVLNTLKSISDQFSAKLRKAAS